MKAPGSSEARVCRQGVSVRARALLVANALFAASTQAQTYLATDIGTLGGSIAEPRGVSPQGLIVGSSTKLDGSRRAFLWDGTMHDLGTMPGAGDSYGDSVNDARQVVGNFRIGTFAYSFFWENGVMVNADPLGTEGASGARSINASGQFCGATNRPSLVYRGVTWTSAAPTSPVVAAVPWGGRCTPFYQINEAGVIAGEAYTGADCGVGQQVAVRFDGTSWTLLYGASGQGAKGVGLNIHGHVVGATVTASGTRPVHWPGASTISVDLGTLGGVSGIAYRINDLDWIVGGSTNAAEQGRATLWHDGLIVDLNTKTLPGSGLTLTVARAINNSGTIVCEALNQAGQTRAALLTLCASVSSHPLGTIVCPGGSAALSVSATGSSLSYQWQGEVNQSPGVWLGIADGLMPGIGTFSGATTPTLTISNVTLNAAGNYRCVVTNACGSVNSNAALLTVREGGYANCDNSTGTPALTANDFQCFLNSFASKSVYANCDGSTGTPPLTANDFQCFLNKFAMGCS